MYGFVVGFLGCMWASVKRSKSSKQNSDGKGRNGASKASKSVKGGSLEEQVRQARVLYLFVCVVHILSLHPLTLSPSHCALFLPAAACRKPV